MFYYKIRPIPVCDRMILMFKIFWYSLYLYQPRNMIFFHFKILQANLMGEKSGTFMVGLCRNLAFLRQWFL